MRIDVHIDRLILEGLPLTRHQGPLVQAAVKQELARLLAADGLSEEARAGGAVAHVKAAGFELREGDHPRRLGQQIARSVYRIAGGDLARGHAEGTRS